MAKRCEFTKKKTKRKNNRPIKIFSLNNLHDDNCFFFFGYVH